MAASNPTSALITEIEEQIAKITAELEKARALEYSIAEKAFLAAQKRTAAAQAKVDDLTAKAGTTAAAQSRLALAKSALTEQEVLLADATTLFNTIKAKQDAADEFAKNVALVLSGKKLGKKIKLTKKEKAVVKEDKKAAKKVAKQEKKAAKKHAKDEKNKNEKSKSENKDDAKKQNTNKKPEKKQTAPVTETAAVVTPVEKPAVKAPAKKTVAKKPVAKRAPVKQAELLVAPANTEETPVVAETPAQPPAVLPEPIAVETPAVESGKDAVVERETLPASESPLATNQPIND